MSHYESGRSVQAKFANRAGRDSLFLLDGYPQCFSNPSKGTHANDSFLRKEIFRGAEVFHSVPCVCSILSILKW